MDLLKNAKREIPCLKSVFALVLGGVGLFSSLIVMVACGNFYLYKLLLMPRHAPPPLLFFLAVLLFCAFVGYLLGVITSYMRKGRGINALLFGILSLIFFFLWYISFFKTAALLFALFLLVMALLMVLMTFRECLPLGVFPPLFAVLDGVFLLFFLWLTFSAVILN